MKNTITIGMDIGDRINDICILDAEGEVVERERVANTSEGLDAWFKEHTSGRVIMEVGTHSGWISRMLESQGHHVIVANARKVRAIWDSDYKDDRRDAELLARIGRLDPKLLHPVKHRGEQAQVDLGMIKSRDILVRSRTTFICHVRGILKSFGHRAPTCSAASFHKRMEELLPKELEGALNPVLQILEDLHEQIKTCDREIQTLCTRRYPETEKLQRVSGVGPITALAFVLTLEDPGRFKKSRDVGPFLGLVPKRDQSGDTDKQLSITKAGDIYLRRLLVGSAQYILGPFGPDCDLKRFGQRISDRGGKNAKRRATVAVARKLAVLLHALWISDEPYDPAYALTQKPEQHAA